MLLCKQGGRKRDQGNAAVGNELFGPALLYNNKEIKMKTALTTSKLCLCTHMYTQRIGRRKYADKKQKRQYSKNYMANISVIG